MGGWVGWVILRVFSLFLCPLSMSPGYLSFLLQSPGGASVTQKALRSATTVRGRSDWLRAQPEAEVVHAHGRRRWGSQKPPLTTLALSSRFNVCLVQYQAVQD